MFAHLSCASLVALPRDVTSMDGPKDKTAATVELAASLQEGSSLPLVNLLLDVHGETHPPSIHASLFVVTPPPTRTRECAKEGLGLAVQAPAATALMLLPSSSTKMCTTSQSSIHATPFTSLPSHTPPFMVTGALALSTSKTQQQQQPSRRPKWRRVRAQQQLQHS